MSSPQPANFLVDTTSHPILMRVEGRATYLNCAPVERFLDQLITDGTPGLQIDLAQCTGMDSTFLGLLAGAALRLKKRQPPGKIILRNLTGRNLDLIRTLGIQTLLEIAEAAPSTPQDTAGAKPLGNAAAPVDRQAVIHAHEHLIAANPGNASSFQDIVDYLSRHRATKP